MAAPTPPPARPAGYPKERRLRRERDFAPLRSKARRFTGAQALVRVMQNGLDGPRLGLATPQKYGGAVRRNRFRRLARTAFRLLGPRLGPRDLLVSPRRDLVEPTLEGLMADLAAAAGVPRTDA